MHFHAPIHPFQKRPLPHYMDLMNLILILLGLLLAILISPVHLD